jgi:hypothetical protein
MENDRRCCKKSLHSFFEVAALVFRRPYRIAAARSRAAGDIGRGLSIVKLVLQRHDTLFATATRQHLPGRRRYFAFPWPRRTPMSLTRRVVDAGKISSVLTSRQ